MELRDALTKSASQTAIITLSAFAGGFAGNFLSTNPGSFEKIGATIALLVLLFPTTAIINVVFHTSNNDNKEASADSATTNNQNGCGVTVEVPSEGKVVVMNVSSNVVEDALRAAKETNVGTEIKEKTEATSNNDSMKANE